MPVDVASIRQAIEEYVAGIETPEFADGRRLEALPAVLDRLAASVHEAGRTFDQVDYPDAPELDSRSVRFLVQRHFPTLGAYNLADPTTRQIGDASIIVGDAIDDLADIYAELKETLWRWEHTSQGDALWHFAWSYRSHWGLHVLEAGVDEASE